MSDFFVPQSRFIDLKRKSSIINPVLHRDSENEHLVFLLEKPKSIKILKRFMKISMGRDIDVLYLSIIPFKAEEKEIKRTVTDFYEKNSIDLKKYIKPYSKIICEGRSLNKLSFGNLSVYGFYDNIFNKTHYYSPQLKSYIFPIDSIEDWIDSDNWKRHFAKEQIKKAIKFKSIKKREKKIQKVILSPDYIETFYGVHKNKKEISIDTETDGLDFMVNKLGFISFAFDTNTGYFLDCSKIDLKRFGKFISDKFQIYQNGKFDIKMLLKHGIPRECLHIDFDTWNAGHLLNEMRSNSLSSLTWIYTDEGGYDKPLLDYKRKYKNADNYLKYPSNLITTYSIMDAVVTFEIYKKTLAHMQKIDTDFPLNNDWGLLRYYNELVIPSLNMYIDVEYEGAYLEPKEMRKAGENINKEIKVLKKEMFEELNITNLDLDSPQVVAKFLMNRGLPPLAVGKSGQYLTGEEYLLKWQKMGHKEAEYLLKYRGISTLKKTFIGEENEGSGYWKYLIKHEDGTYRVHPDFLVMLTKSHRNKCKNPNLQQVPIQDKEQAKKVRKFFVPPSEDYYFLSADFAGLQLRLISMLLPEGCLMRRVFQDMSGDMHSMTAASILLNNKIPFEEFLERKNEPELDAIRFKSKGVNFGSAFGAGPSTIMRTAIEPNWTMEECEKHIDDFDLEIIEYKNNLMYFLLLLLILERNILNNIQDLILLLRNQKRGLKSKVMCGLFMELSEDFHN